MDDVCKLWMGERKDLCWEEDRKREIEEKEAKRGHRRKVCLDSINLQLFESSSQCIKRIWETMTRKALDNENGVFERERKNGWFRDFFQQKSTLNCLKLPKITYIEWMAWTTCAVFLSKKIYCFSYAMFAVLLLSSISRSQSASFLWSFICLQINFICISLTGLKPNSLDPLPFMETSLDVTLFSR